MPTPPPSPSKGDRALGATPRATPLQLDLARRIAQDIVDGTIGLGDHLTEESLAAQFQVSRTPVRGALRLLAEQDAIAYRPNAGYFVERMPAAVPDFGQGISGDDLYRMLVDARARKDLPDTLIEKDLLQQYQVNRSLLAKVLMRMTADGLIGKRQGHGWQFMPSLESPEALKDSYRFRMIVECAGLLEPTFAVDPAQLQRSREAHERLVADHGATPTAADFFALNTAFHEMLARFSGNRFVLQAVQQQNQLRRLEEHAAFFRLDRQQDSCREHLQIIEALEKNDPEWAAAMMRRHLSTARDMSV